MERLYTCCAGWDVHKQTVVACLLQPEGEAQGKELRTFGTTTRELTQLRTWLLAAGCTHVAMEATGSFWKPVDNILEGHCTLLVGNAAPIKQVPGARPLRPMRSGARPSGSRVCCAPASSRVGSSASCAT